jgi:hypothetical protein
MIRLRGGADNADLAEDAHDESESDSESEPEFPSVEIEATTPHTITTALMAIFGEPYTTHLNRSNCVNLFWKYILPPGIWNTYRQEIGRDLHINKSDINARLKQLLRIRNQIDELYDADDLDVQALVALMDRKQVYENSIVSWLVGVQGQIPF